MKVNTPSSVRPAQGPRKTAGTTASSGVSFEGLLGTSAASGMSETPPSSGLAGVGSVDGLLAMQSMSDEQSSRQQTMREGHSMLDALENLRRSLLAGSVPPEVLRELDARLARQRTAIADPHLLALMDDIELRVAVEKAKLDQALALQEAARKNIDIA